ncbi:MAG: glycosyltransferase family 4 protein [Anaerolineae bacterium]|nr:glycosyltransferase family 4 protein [Anaerolineae bacterium]
MGLNRAIHQIAPAFPYGDAIGNQMFRIRQLLRQWGIESQVYIQYPPDPRMADPGQHYTDYPSSADNILIYHYSTLSPLTEFVLQLPDTVIVYYHNVTPAWFFAPYDPAFAAMLEQGRRDVALFKDHPLAWAASEYNRQEMLALGFTDVDVVALFLYHDELLAAADAPAGQEIAARYRDGWVNLLFVGRLAPNKCQDDLVRSFAYYHQRVNPNSRLFLVGSDGGLPAYRLKLEVMIDSFDLSHVYLPGSVSLEQLGGYYGAATLFLCLSEHEGFGIPLVEAMAFDLPVLAFKAAAIPHTLGDAGVLIRHKRYDVIGELVDLVAHDEVLRQQIVRKQRERLAELGPQQAGVSLRQALRRLGVPLRV